MVERKSILIFGDMIRFMIAQEMIAQDLLRELLDWKLTHARDVVFWGSK